MTSRRQEEIFIHRLVIFRGEATFTVDYTSLQLDMDSSGRSILTSCAEPSSLVRFEVSQSYGHLAGRWF